MGACSGHCGVSGEHRHDTHTCPGRPAWHAPGLVAGLPLFVLRVRQGCDHGGGQRCWDAPRRAYPLTPETDALHPPSPNRPLTPGEALEKLFLDNADRGANAENDELVVRLREALRQRVQAIQALADPRPHDAP
jgi:hypothetical protein